MNEITLYVLLGGVCATVAGLILQAAGHFLFSRYRRDDTKELAGVVGLRVSAIFGIAVGLIFASSAAHLMETKRNLLEEARLIGNLHILTAEAPTLENRGAVQEDVKEFAKRSVKELDAPHGIDNAARVTNHLLLQICRAMALDDQDTADERWTKTEFQRACGKLIDLRGTKRVGARETLIGPSFWIFFAISFSFLAFLFGVFEARPLNIVFACLFFFATGVTGMIIYAASDPYHAPGRISSAPLARLLEPSTAAPSP